MRYDNLEIREELVQVEEFVRRNTTSRNRLLAETVNDLVTAGGKRLRPAMLILSAKFGKYDSDKVIPVAGAIEILHTATLVHDDVIDRSRLRRGKSTVFEKHGVDMAVYTGDFLYTKAVLMLSKDLPIDRLEMVAKAVKTICEGEVDQYQDRFNTGVSVLSYLKRISRKTALLFGASCGVGAFLGECREDWGRALAKFGFYYGMAFQIKDDLNDFTSDLETSGKPVCKDILEGTITLPVIYAIRKNPLIKETVVSLMGRDVKPGKKDIAALISAVKSEGGLQHAKAMLDRYVERGKVCLEALPENPYRKILRDLVEKLGE